MVYGIELVALRRVVPYAGIDDDLLSVMNVFGIGYADFLGVVVHEVVVVEYRALNQIHPS